MEFAPIVVFAFNRPDKINNLLDSLMQCEHSIDSDLFVYVDGPRNDKDIDDINATVEIIKAFEKQKCFKSMHIVISDNNKGLANSITQGVSEVIRNYGKAIVLEDDLVVDTTFVNFMNQALSYYQNDNRIGMISGYSYPITGLNELEKDVYFLKKGDCWGWATWADRWNDASWMYVDKKEYLSDKRKRKEFEKIENGLDVMMVNMFSGRNHSWAVRWLYYLFNNNFSNVYPKISLVSNEGFDGRGTHSVKGEASFFNSLLNDKSCFEFIDYKGEESIDEKLSFKVAAYPRPVWYKYYLYRIYALLYRCI